MSLPLPGIGILFDIDALGGGHYGYQAWQIFMRHIRSDDLSACVLVEGDALMSLAGSENLFASEFMGWPISARSVRGSRKSMRRVSRRCQDEL